MQVYQDVLACGNKVSVLLRRLLQRRACCSNNNVLLAAVRLLQYCNLQPCLLLCHQVADEVQLCIHLSCCLQFAL